LGIDLDHIAPPSQDRTMKLLRMTDYALRVLIYVGERPGRRCSVPEIAAAHHISAHHLVKIVHQLGRLGYLDTVRGRGGGVSLQSAPDQINLGALVRHFEGDDPVVDCNNCVLRGNCKLACTLKRSEEAFYARLGEETLAHVIRPQIQPQTEAIKV
jgi:Rrf2 family nitric oxide-sensitive transcriptional repressor